MKNKIVERGRDTEIGETFIGWLIPPKGYNDQGPTQAKARSLALHAGLLHEWNRPKHLGYPLLLSKTG